MSDLSEYERRRLANIERNNSFLLSLGLPSSSSSSETRTKTEDKSLDKDHRRASVRVAASPQRRSARVLGQKGVVVEQSSTPDTSEDALSDHAVDYADMPTDPRELDDHEFQVFLSLRAWRLARRRELDTEAYKIFQNRALCEAVRRRRNSPSWGDEGEKQLLDCWGIGQRKVGTRAAIVLCAMRLSLVPLASNVSRCVEAGGFAWELLRVLREADNEALLECSRRGEQA